MNIHNEGSAMPIEPDPPIKIFYCYAQEDRRFRDMVEKHLSTLKRSSWVSSWHDGMINAGEDWAQKIDEQIKAANIILLLISPDFMHSDYWYGIGMKRALERHEANKARVIPIILRPTDWKDAPFAKLSVLPPNAKPLTRWKDRDEFFLEIANGIRKAVRELLRSQKTADQWMEEGSRLIHLNRLEDALTAFTYATELAPYSAMAYSGKGAVLEHLGRYEEALELREEAIRIALRSAEGNKFALLRPLSVSGGIETEAFMAVFYSDKGRLLNYLNRLEESLAAYNQAIDFFPDSALYFERGLVFLKLQRHEEALSDFEQAIDLSPNDEEAYLNYAYKGFTLSSLGRTEDALNAYEQALALNPNYSSAFTFKGVLLGRLKRFEEALVSLEHAIQLDPSSIEAHTAKADCLYELGNYEEALAAYKQVIHLDDKNYYALCRIGDTLLKLNRNEEARRAFDAAIYVDSNNEYANRRKADILEELGHDFISIEQILNTNSDNEENDPFLDTDHPERLLNFCEQELQRDPQNLKALVAKCVALSNLHRHQEAYDLYTDLLQKYPDLEWGVKGRAARYIRSVLEAWIIYDALEDQKINPSPET